MMREVDQPVDPSAYYWKGELRALPERPGDWARFDTVSEQWIDQVDAVSVTTAKRKAVAEINRVVGWARQQFVSSQTGQDTVYEEKAKEGRRYILQVLEPLNLSDFPMLENEVGVTAPTAYELAQIWVNRNDMDRSSLALIEGVKFRHLDQLSSAQSTASVASVLATATDALAALVQQT